MRIQHNETISAPIERVWALTLDVESWPQLSPTTITSMECLQEGPLRPGSTVRCKQPGQRSKIWTVSVVDAPNCFAWSARVFGTTMTATHILGPTAAGTSNTLAIDIEAALAPVVGRLVRRSISKVIALENHGFKTAAEAGVQSGGR